MVTRIFDWENDRAFIDSFVDDPEYSDPHFIYSKDNLYRAIHCEDQYLLRVTDAGKTIGMFVLLLLKEEQYAECLIGFAREKKAYREFFSFLEKECADCHVDFVINPNNMLFREVLTEHHAVFEAEQMKMVCQECKGIPLPQGIVQYSAQYQKQYIDIHRKNIYWTADKVINALDRFRVFLAFHQQRLVGYIDVTYGDDENEIYDLYVSGHFGDQGYEQALLLAALQENYPNRMMILLEKDDIEDIHLLESVGFVSVEHQNSVTAHWNLKKHNNNF